MPGSSKSKQIEIAGHELHCQICRHDRFLEQRVQMNTTGFTFFDLDWLNKSATCYICDDCGYIHWFLKDLSDPRLGPFPPK